MKKFILSAITSIIIFTILLSGMQVFACSSFAVYSKNTLYGSNFDYPDTEMVVKIIQNGNTKALLMSVISKNGEFNPNELYNTNGLYMNQQMQYPQVKANKLPMPGECFFDAMNKFIYSTGDVNQIKNFLSTKRIIQYPAPTPTIHSMVADKNGNAMIVETGYKNNEILPIKNKFIVMTNFRNSDYKDTDYRYVYGAGADRYKTLYQYISKNFNDFNNDSGMEALKEVRQFGGDYPTQYSMVFNTQNNNIFISFKNDFNKVWKIDLNNSIIETYKGFNQYARFKLNAKGITVRQLENYKSYSDGPSLAVKVILGAALIGLFLLLLIAFNKIKNKRRLFITWSVLALILTFPITYILKGIYPVLAFIFIIVPLIYSLLKKSVDNIAVKAVPVKDLVKYTIINLVIAGTAAAALEPWLHTYKFFIDFMVGYNYKLTTFTWLTHFSGLPAMAGMYLYSGLITIFSVELFFRGFILNLLSRKTGNTGAILIQSVIFAVVSGAILFMFIPLEQVLIFTVFCLSVGIVGGWTASKTHSILSSLFTIATLNFVFVLLML